MIPQWLNLNEKEQTGYRATVAFLNGRLEERATVNWALNLKPKDKFKQLALIDLLDRSDGLKINEPWRTAWRLIEEFWNVSDIEVNTSMDEYHLKERLSTGDRSGALVAAIVNLVAPQLKVKPFSDIDLYYRTLPKHPKNIEEMFSTSLTSGKIIDPDELGLSDVTDKPFLMSLAHALDAAVVSGLDIARRVGWDGEHHFWQLGQLNRVYYVPDADRVNGEDEPDEFNQGIAPSVKLLHYVVARLSNIDITSAVEFVCRWKLIKSPVHQRLWAALSRDPGVTDAKEVGMFLLPLENNRFWDLQNYPEIAELRAKRFAELEAKEQKILTARIRKRPPRNIWPKKADYEQVENARFSCAIRELLRIEIAGATLPEGDKSWVDTRIHEFPELAKMNRIDDGFSYTLKARFVAPNPDNQYDLLIGEQRLQALEVSLKLARRVWDNDPAERASDWIRLPGNINKVLLDLESSTDAGVAYAMVWENFGWTHSPNIQQNENTTPRDVSDECARVLRILEILPEVTVRQAIDGISHWFSTWQKLIVMQPEWYKIWFKLWPIAIEITNAKKPVEEEIELNAILQQPENKEPKRLDTLNNPVGKLVGVFLSACPNLRKKKQPFAVGGVLRRIRDMIIDATGPSGLIAHHRMIEALPYFLIADRKWAQPHLVAPLTATNTDGNALWHAIARRTQFYDVLKVIGGPMVERATNLELGRESRKSLVFSLIIETLYSFYEKRDPAVPRYQITQMIRSLDDEVRVYAAETVQLFVRDLSKQQDGKTALSTPEHLFSSAAKPFLEEVWPQERSLVTLGVSRALADLPATARGAFVEAVDSIKRFLLPFDCWSMHNYGLYGEEGDKAKLTVLIDTKLKAAKFLQLLNLTIGTSEGSVIPHDLADALDQIRSIAPNLVEDHVFRRLAAAARRR
jgi:hypothetical protein